MTRKEFAAAAEKMTRRGRWANRLWLTIFFVILFGNLVVVRLIPENYAITYLVGFFVFLIANIIFTMRIAKNRSRRAGVICSKCKSTFSKTGLELAIATGNCSSCSEKFLDD
ncbi:MAG: hypothetical protein GXP15_01890 [Gammaproteobacteria bacterium]|nr:hypothetical protein [Gammaproteobacteria bacterium]